MDTLVQLLTDDNATVIRARLVANLTAAGFPVSSWSPSASGGPENAFLDAVSGTMATYGGKLASTLAAMYLLDLSTGDLLTFYAATKFFIDRDLATKTRISLRLRSTVDAPPYTITAGDFWFAGLTGNRYVSVTGGELKPGTDLFIEAEAELAGAAYQDPDGYIDSTTNAGAMITALPGVDVLNISTRDITAPKLIGYSAGTIDAAFTVVGVRPTYATIRLRIQTSGNIGAGLWQYSTNGGLTWASAGPLVATVALPGGVTLYFANAPGVATSFLAGDTWSMQVATSTLFQGEDDETDDALRARCRSRWPALSDVPTAGKVSLWAHRAVAGIGQVLVDADITRPGQTNVIIAGASGAIGQGTASDVQDFIGPRLLGYQGLSIAETVLVEPATPHAITTSSGTVTVPRRSLATVQTAALTNWLSYFRSVPIGGVVRLSELIQALMDAGAANVDSAALNGGGPNIQLASTEVAVPPSDGTTILTTLAWVPS